MKCGKMWSVSTVLAFCVSLSACNQRVAELPTINETNCTADKISKISNESSRKEFADRCARRNTFKPSPKVVW